MKNMLAVNFRPKGKLSESELRELIDAQIENSVSLGWAARDIVIVTNMAIDVSATVVPAPLNETCLTGSKMFALHHLFGLGLIRGDEVWWAHDLDAWQNHWFDPPELLDIGLAEYSRPKFNGGSVLLRPGARDMVAAIIGGIMASKAHREEPAIDAVLRSDAFRYRVTVLDSTFNVGCSSYAVRHGRSTKPILVSHFNPKSRPSWRTHIHGDRKLRETSVSPRLYELLLRRFHGGVPPNGGKLRAD